MLCACFWISFSVLIPFNYQNLVLFCRIKCAIKSSTSISTSNSENLKSLKAKTINHSKSKKNPHNVLSRHVFSELGIFCIIIFWLLIFRMNLLWGPKSSIRTFKTLILLTSLQKQNKRFESSTNNLPEYLTKRGCGYGVLKFR